MNDSMDDPPHPLSYSRHEAEESSWPVGIYLGALLWAFITMRWYTAVTTGYRDESLAQFRTQVALLGCALLRLVWARLRRERGIRWAFYIALLVLSPILWAFVSPALGRLGRSLWGGP
jgi:hypothetical protein